MIQWKWKMLAIPSAKERIMHSTPVLNDIVSDLFLFF